MRIVHISDNLPPYHKGGAELSCAATMRELRRRGHAVFAVTNDVAGREQTDDHTSYIETACYWGCRDTRLLLDNYARLKARLLEIGPDVVHVHSFEGRLHGALRLAHDFPTVYVAHNYTMEVAHTLRASYFARTPTHILSKRALVYAKHLIARDRGYIELMLVDNLPLLRAIVCPSEFMRRRLSTLVEPERLSVIYNGVEDLYSDAEVSNDTSRMLFVGRLDTSKGVDYIVEAADRLNRDGHPTSVTIVGDGPHGDRLRATISKLGLDSVVSMVPAVPHVDYAKYPGVLVYPSVWDENCSMTILEGLSAGKAVICTGQGGNKELVTHLYNGLIVKPRDARGIADAVTHLRQEPGLTAELSQNARATFLSTFTLERQVDQLEHLYAEVVDRPVVRPLRVFHSARAAGAV